MVVELINTGSELMLGRVLNTHQQWLCRQLADLGYVVTRQVAVPDTGSGHRASRAGGARARRSRHRHRRPGPDFGRPDAGPGGAVAGKELREDAAVLAHISHFFERRKRPMPERTRVQALVPEGATGPAQSARHRAGPGDGSRGLIRFAPAASRAGSSCCPARRASCGRCSPTRSCRCFSACCRLAGRFVCRTLRTTGIGESVVQEKIGGPLQRWVEAGLDLGYCARPGQVDVRLAARGSDAEQQVREAESHRSGAARPAHLRCGRRDLETVIVRLLTERKATLALAESCTGGCIANRMTNVPGASAVLLAGLVTYSNAAKQKFLGVQADTLAQHGAVSEAVAREMAEGARRQTQADYALSVTGIAGPSGGTPDKPVGTVFIGLAGPAGTVVERQFNPYDRETFKQVTAQQALDLLRRTYSQANGYDGLMNWASPLRCSRSVMSVWIMLCLVATDVRMFKLLQEPAVWPLIRAS